MIVKEFRIGHEFVLYAFYTCTSIFLPACLLL